MKTLVAAFAITLISLVLLDGLWISLVMSELYKKHLDHLMADAITIWPIPIFYLLYSFGICYFVIRPALNSKKPWYQIVGAGWLLGMLAYGAYDFTNHATLREWPLIITVVDIAWGSLMTGVSALAGAWLAERMTA